MWKTTFVASGYICFVVYFDFVKVIFWLSPKLYLADAEVAVFIHNLPTAHTALLKSHCRGRQCSLLCLFAPFFSTQVQKYLAWVL